MAGLNFQQALQELATTPHTQADLKALLDRVSADSSGSRTVLYGGPVAPSGPLANLPQNNLIVLWVEQGADIRVINKTAAVQLT
jgi:hypothetical protein